MFGIEVNWLPGAKGWEMKEIPGTEFVLPADLVLIAMGFLHVVRSGLVEELGVKIDNRGNVAVDNWMSSVPGVFAAGDTVSRGVARGSRHQPGPHHGRRRGQVAANVKDRCLRFTSPGRRVILHLTTFPTKEILMHEELSRRRFLKDTALLAGAMAAMHSGRRG